MLFNCVNYLRSHILRQPRQKTARKHLAQNAKVELRQLSMEPFILFPRSLAPGLYDRIISFCQQAGFSPIAAQEAIQMQTIVSPIVSIALIWRDNPTAAVQRFLQTAKNLSAHLMA